MKITAVAISGIIHPAPGRQKIPGVQKLTQDTRAVTFGGHHQSSANRPLELLRLNLREENRLVILCNFGTQSHPLIMLQGDSTAPQMQYESSTRNSHPDYSYKTERPVNDSYAYPHAHQSSDMRRSEETRGWRIPNQTNISGSRRSYVERSRSRSPVSPVRRHSESRRDPSPASWNRGIDSSSDYISSTAAANRASYSSDMYGRKSNGSAADQDYNRGRNHAQSQRASSRSFSRVIDYGHRSGMFLHSKYTCTGAPFNTLSLLSQSF
ncbi:unnamed protein product [Dibothriocephalus latus]|uniref:Uncharacterized protein n=1 Tax=Dibothriocephalus latus TaxID=60516 RepID=A0A3P6P849_DIBLA|nr:unnamed protein product [Dibothriocephalus latus]